MSDTLLSPSCVSLLCKLNRNRSGAGRFNAEMFSDTEMTPCVSVDHLLECPACPPVGNEDILAVNEVTRLRQLDDV